MQLVHYILSYIQESFCFSPPNLTKCQISANRIFSADIRLTKIRRLSRISAAAAEGSKYSVQSLSKNTFTHLLLCLKLVQKMFGCVVCFSFLIANDCRLCDNDHVFCHSCIVAWSMTFGDNAHRCPVCR